MILTTHTHTHTQVAIIVYITVESRMVFYSCLLVYLTFFNSTKFCNVTDFSFLSVSPTWVFKNFDNHVINVTCMAYKNSKICLQKNY